MQPLKLGFIGAGEMAAWAVYPALHFAPIDLQGVCDLDEARARSVAGRFGTGRWYTDYRRMWEKEDLEAVVVHMHPAARQALVLEALEAGYHVLVPKPPAMSLAATVELADAAQRSGRILMVNFQRRFSYGITRAREIVAEPSFGRVTQIFLSFCSGRYDETRARGYESPIHAYLLDFSVHHLDLARFIGGEVESLSLFHRELDHGLALALAVKFESGAVGTLQLNSHRIWWRNYDRIEITGEREYVVVDGLWSVKHYAESRNTFTENYSDQRSGELTGDGHALNEFVRAIREGREPVAGIHDAVKTMRLYHAVSEAVRDGREGVIGLPGS